MKMFRRLSRLSPIDPLPEPRLNWSPGLLLHLRHRDFLSTSLLECCDLLDGPPARRVGGRRVVGEAKSVRLQHDSGKEVWARGTFSTCRRPRTYCADCRIDICASMLRRAAQREVSKLAVLSYRVGSSISCGSRGRAGAGNARTRPPAHRRRSCRVPRSCRPRRRRAPRAIGRIRRSRRPRPSSR